MLSGLEYSQTIFLEAFQEKSHRIPTSLSEALSNFRGKLGDVLDCLDITTVQLFPEIVASDIRSVILGRSHPYPQFNGEVFRELLTDKDMRVIYRTSPKRSVLVAELRGGSSVQSCSVHAYPAKLGGTSKLCIEDIPQSNCPEDSISAKIVYVNGIPRSQERIIGDLEACRLVKVVSLFENDIFPLINPSTSSDR